MIKNTLRNRMTRWTLTAALAGIPLLGLTGNAQARERDRDRDRGPEIAVGIGFRHEEPARIDRIWIPEQVRVVQENVWVPATYRTVCDRVWREPVTQTSCQRVLVPARYEFRNVISADRWGRRTVARQQVCVEPAHYVEQPTTVIIAPGHWENVERQELVCAGHYEVRERREVVCAGHWEVRPEPRYDRERGEHGGIGIFFNLLRH